MNCKVSDSLIILIIEANQYKDSAHLEEAFLHNIDNRLMSFILNQQVVNETKTLSIKVFKLLQLRSNNLLRDKLKFWMKKELFCTRKENLWERVII